MSRGRRLQRTPAARQNLGVLRPYDPFAQFRALAHRRPALSRPQNPERYYRNARVFTESLSIGLVIAGVVLVAVTILLVVVLIRSL